MFVNVHLVLCSSNEAKLDNLRISFLYVLNEDNDFPFGLPPEPKYRLHTRNGDNVAVKLAYVVHV